MFQHMSPLFKPQLFPMNSGSSAGKNPMNTVHRPNQGEADHEDPNLLIRNYTNTAHAMVTPVGTKKSWSCLATNWDQTNTEVSLLNFEKSNNFLSFHRCGSFIWLWNIFLSLVSTSASSWDQRRSICRVSNTTISISHRRPDNRKRGVETRSTHFRTSEVRIYSTK